MAMAFQAAVDPLGSLNFCTKISQDARTLVVVENISSAL